MTQASHPSAPPRRGWLTPPGLKWGLLLGALGVVLVVSGCTSLGYMMQATKGHLSIMFAREDVDALIENPDTSDGLAERLRRIRDARQFAVKSLSLPDNESYRTYVDLERGYVVWNVVAAPALSLSPKTWCFPVAGCIAYRGYFDRGEAEAFAESLRTEGFDVFSGPVRAYSTLGWFPDPLLNTIVNQPEHYAAGIMFHELAHQVVYIQDDSRFNEAFAVATQRAGVRRWLAAQGSDDELAKYERSLSRHADFLALVGETRDQLKTLYRSKATTEAKQTKKTALFRELQQNYAKLRERWGGYRGYDRWFSQDLNNAKLAAVATYHARVGAFEQLLVERGDDLASFYKAVERLGARERVAREAELDQLEARRLVSQPGDIAPEKKQ